MCTIEQKDVLIEFIAHLNAKILLSRPKGVEMNEDEIYLGQLRNHVYSTNFSELDYDNIVKKLKTIKSGYNNFESFKEHSTWLI